MNTQNLVDLAMTLDVGPALAILVSVYGKDSRVYSVTFDESNGKWCISAMSTDTGKVISRFTQN
jgi:hypothetical protein